MTASQPLVGTMTADQPLGEMTATVRLIDLVVMVWSTLRSQENRKTRKRLSPENRLSQKKIHQKVGIYFILALRNLDRSS